MFFKKFLLGLFNNLLQKSDIEEFLSSKRISSCLLNVNISHNSRFYPEASVVNLSFKKERIRIGTNTHIRGELVVFASGGNIIIGNDCFIGIGSKVWSQEEIKIGNHVLISHNVNIHDTNSHPVDYEQRRIDYNNIINSGFPKINNNIKTKPIIIEDDVWIGFNSIILKGVTIGKASIVSAGSVVTENVPENVVVAGNPAKIIKQL